MKNKKIIKLSKRAIKIHNEMERIDNILMLECDKIIEPLLIENNFQEAIKQVKLFYSESRDKDYGIVLIGCDLALARIYQLRDKYISYTSCLDLC